MKFAITLLLLTLAHDCLAADKYSFPDLDWSQVDVERPDSEIPHGILAVKYTIDNIVEETEIFPLSFVRSGGDFPVRISMSGKCRDGLDGQWCNGGGNLKKANKDGILFSVNLTWGRRGSPNVKDYKGEYKNTILIPWQSEFTYHDNIIKIEARIAWFIQPEMKTLIDRQVKKAEQGAAASP